MSIQIDNAFVQQFSSNLIRLSQQEGSRLLSTVMEQSVVGKMAHFDRMAKLAAKQKTSRHSTVEHSDTPHSRRTVSLVDKYVSDLIDREDEVRMLISPKSQYAQNMADALGRDIDGLIIAAATGNSTATDASDASSSIALPASQIVGEDVGGTDSNLTLVKMLRAKRILDENEVGNREPRYLVVNSNALENLLNDTTITSDDFNKLKPLVSGELTSFLGFNIVRSEELLGVKDGTDTDPIKCLAYVPSGIGFGMGKNVAVRMSEIPEKHYANMVYADYTGGAVRIEEEKVVEIQCVQS